MKVAIMQPYVFPYIGYFQMVKAVDVFVLYDDVNFIKRGWINRNKILANQQESLFSIPLQTPSQNDLINNTFIHIESFSNWLKKFGRTLHLNYRNAPFFYDIFPLVNQVLANEDNLTIADLAQQSIQIVMDYLGIKTKLIRSSVFFGETKSLDRAERLVAICQNLQATQYINALGGQELYEKPFFQAHGIDLYFIKSLPIHYQQYQNEFVPWLSIIDVMMFNSPEEINVMLDQYELL